MNAYTVDFDIDIGNSIDLKFTNQLLTDFPNIRVLDVDYFKEKTGYDPVVASIFMVSNGGSYTTTVNNNNYTILNGTLFCYSLYWLQYSKQMKYKSKPSNEKFIMLSQ